MSKVPQDEKWWLFVHALIAKGFSALDAQALADNPDVWVLRPVKAERPEVEPR